MEKILQEKNIYESILYKLKEAEIDFANGKVSKFEYVSFKDEGDGVMIVALDDDNNIFLIEQFQIGAKKRLLVLPRGGVMSGETLEEKANIELQEEIGMKAKNMKYLTKLEIFPGYVKATSHLFLATNLEASKLTGDEHESLIVKKIKLNDAIKMILNGEIQDSRTIAGILFVEKYILYQYTDIK